ncbi:MAG: GNAT family N-acetyltransferase [Crocinitomicaceae bacterium]|nr:GNAT family N-acetyltransferase [Crocinitomicaceae bacterium]|tara:strand:- start:39992 stop:40435 length:444 start_codon:yes stop_codon:yes gene_type:complete
MIIRQIEERDIQSVMDLIIKLAEYEGFSSSVENTPEKLLEDIFTNHYCDAIVAEKNNLILGFALYYTSYSTWNGPCLYLEDLFVLNEYRSQGVGSKLFDNLVLQAQKEGFSRMDWQIVDWNDVAIDFYKYKGAVIDRDWLNGRIFFE